MSWTGTVKFFDPVRGYGFIDCDAGGDIFVHINEVQASPFAIGLLERGDRVSFDTGKDRLGRTKATNLRAASGRKPTQAQTLAHATEPVDGR